MMGMAQEKMSEENLAEKEIIVNEELRPANLNADAGRKQPESGFQKTLVKNEITYFQSESSGGVLFGVKKSAAKILIVDDVASIVMTVRKFLEHHGYNVITANDGKEGLEKARAEQPDLIILDLMLPKMDGYKVCGLLKKDKRYAKTPIILFTSAIPEENMNIGQEVGADAYLNKPFDPEILLSKIGELIRK